MLVPSNTGDHKMHFIDILDAAIYLLPVIGGLVLLSSMGVRAFRRFA